MKGAVFLQKKIVFEGSEPCLGIRHLVQGARGTFWFSEYGASGLPSAFGETPGVERSDAPRQSVLTLAGERDVHCDEA